MQRTVLQQCKTAPLGKLRTFQKNPLDAAKRKRQSLPVIKTSQIQDNATDEQDETEVFIDIPDPKHILVSDDFPAPLAHELRAHFDQRFADPLQTTSDRFVWDYWNVPGQYSLHRTPADAFFPPELYDRLEDALIEYGERHLGCRGISPVWLSYYVDGCRQEYHTDAPHGPWAFVFSLTDYENRQFSGGETMILNPDVVLDYWRTFEPSTGLETPQLTTLLAPEFGRLSVFDPRLPHGVRIVEGPRDPRHSRIVLHGWFTRPTPFFNGALSEEVATPALNTILEPLYEALGELPPAVGTATVRLRVGASGAMEEFIFLTNTVVARPQGCDDPDGARIDILGCIVDYLYSATWPESDGSTEITLPFIFE